MSSFVRRSAVLHESRNGLYRIVPVVTFHDQPAPGSPWALEQKAGHDTWTRLATGRTLGELETQARGKDSRSPRAEARRWFGPRGVA